MLGPAFIFQQLFDATCNGYTYIIADAKTREGVIIDPVLEQCDRDYKLLQELGISLRYTLDTHVHADHITGSSVLAGYTGAKIAISAAAGVKVDLPLLDGQVVHCGEIQIKAIATPGHTNCCMSFHIGNAVFTGDTLLVRGNGRTDFQNGSPEALYESIMNQLFTLPDETLVFIGHDYNGFTSSTIEMEKKFNKRISAKTTKEQFVHTMNHLNLALPKKIDVAVPANMRSGRS